MNSHKMPFGIFGGALLGIGLSVTPLLASPAPDDHTVLILGSSVRGGTDSLEAVQATALGFTVEIATDDQWAAKSTAEFATYRAIIFGDRNCEGPGILAAPVANRDVWGPAVTGNVVVVGAHTASRGNLKPGAVKLAGASINLATQWPTTGAYVALGCYFNAAPPGTTVEVLRPFGIFSAVGQDGCPEGAHITARRLALPDITDADLSGWQKPRGSCDTDTGFVSWPSSFEVMAISTDTASSFVAADGTTGSPYILARGVGLRGGVTGSSNTVPSVEQAVPEIAPAMAVTATTPLAFSGSGTVQSGGAAAICDVCAPDALFGGDNVGVGIRLNVDVNADWSPTANVDHTYSTALLRQGETLDLVNTLTGGPGPLNITYAVTGDFGIYFNTTFPADASKHGTDTTGISLSATGTGTCSLKLDGDGTYSCSATKTFDIFDGNLFGIASVKITVPVTTTLSVTPAGVVTVRSVSYAGTVATGPTPMTFHGPSPSVLADPLTVACTAPAGADALYKLASTSSDPSVVATTAVKLGVKVVIIITIFDDTFTIATFGPGAPTTIGLTAGDQVTDLGPILVDNRPPLAVAGGPYFGTEGSAVSCSSAGTTDNCASTLSFVWRFSDGGIAFGPAPAHTFADNGAYSGQLEVTDLAGNVGRKDFALFISNANPVVNAGPDTSSAWGVPVTFNGSATDPGSADQPTLVYSWDFGDGSPSASGGASVMHPYASPGTYTGVLTVCDKDGACSSDARLTFVRARGTRVGYLGDHSGTFNSTASLRASLVDEFGVIVPNRDVTFAIGPEAAGSSKTDSSGIAAQSHLVGLGAGGYTATSTFAGDAFYSAAGDASPFTVSQAATSLVYTGALSGGPNKVVSLSAVLKNNAGVPLAGRLITFTLGTQTTSATTDATGRAAVNLQLMQKNGTKPLQATFSPSGADAARYLGSSAAATFQIAGGA